MAKAAQNGKARAVWFGVVDMMILLILAGFICSMFLVDGTGGSSSDENAERLIFSVSVQAPYHEALFLQEGNGNAVPIRLRNAETAFGRLIRGDDGIFYVECDLAAVEASEDRDGLWLLGDTVLMSGSSLSVSSELADFSVTVLSVPETALSGSFGTTEELPETESVPEAEESLEADGEADVLSGEAESGTEISESEDPAESSEPIDESPAETTGK